MRVFRQAAANDWETVIRRLASELAGLASSGRV